MLRTLFALLTVSMIACGAPEPSDNGGGGGGGGTADAGMTEDAGGSTATTICDVHAAGTFSACTGCHGNQGGLTIDNSSPQGLYDSLINNTGATGATLVTPEDRDGSYLWQRVTGSGMSDIMPPNGKLPDALLEPLGQWIADGATSDCL